MKDQVFSGADVPAAVSAASQALGIPEARLRYVVLARETTGGRGLSATPARIAVLMDAVAGKAPLAGPEARPAAGAPRAEARPIPYRHDAAAAIRAAVRALAEASGVELSAEAVPEGEGVLLVRLACADGAFLDAELMEALSHVLSRATHEGDDRRVVLELGGRRHGRDEDTRREAQEAAQAVRGDGRPRELRPMNAYERRVVHVAVSEVPGVRTVSVGQGSERRVRIEAHPAAPAAGTDAPPVVLPGDQGGGGEVM